MCSINHIKNLFTKGAFGISLIALVFCSCTKLVKVDPPFTSTNGENVYTNDASATAVLTAIYAKMSAGDPGTGGSTNAFMELYPALSADEFILLDNSPFVDYPAYYQNAQTINNRTLWSSGDAYNTIYICNAAIEGLANSATVTASVKKQLTGEAKFIRALNYFYLTNLYGAVPLVVSTNYDANRLLPRAPQADVYKQIVDDLKDAQGLLSENFVNLDLVTPGAERVRPSKWAATALLARVYLYTEDWADAETQASVLIDNTTLFGLSTLDQAFLTAGSGNKEAIFQLQPVIAGRNTEVARLFILPVGGPNASNPFYLSNNILNDFEAGDNRRIHWVDSVIVSGVTYHYPYKYKIATLNNPVTEYEMVLRLGEQYLIRAEARAHKASPDLTGAIADLNAIRNRAGLSNYTGATDQPSVLSAIAHERRIELFTEWGHRWLDLKRTKTVDAVMATATTQKGGTWQSFRQWYPIPQGDLLADPNLVQNDGY